MPKKPQRETLAQLEEWQRQLDHASKKACGSMVVIPRLLNHAFWADNKIKSLEDQLTIAKLQRDHAEKKLQRIHELSLHQSRP